MRFHFDPYEIFKKTPPPPAKVAKPAKPGDEQGGETWNFSNFSNFSRPIHGFSENSAPSPALPSPAKDPQAAPVEPTAPGQDEGAADTIGPDLDAWRKDYIAKEQSTWTPERRQAQADELKTIEEYRRTRGPVPPGPAAGSIPRSEVFAAIGEVMEKLGKIWPCGLEPDPVWQDKINTAAQTDRETFLATVQEWEQSESRRVESFMDKIRKTVFGWPDPYRRRFALMVKGFQDGNRGMGFTVRALNHNQAQEKAYNDLQPFIPAAEQDTPPAQADDFPFTDNIHPDTVKIILRHWRTWPQDRRQRFIKDVEDTMKRTRYSTGNACAYVLQSGTPGNISNPSPDLSPEEKEELHKRMWPTPPQTPPQKPKSAVSGTDIAKLVSGWPRHLRLEYSGRVGRYSNSMPMESAMAKAFSELRNYPRGG